MAKAKTKAAHVEAQVRQRIASGEWSTGTMLPPERELAALFQVSRMTLRGGMHTIEQEGLIQRLRGKGTVVTDDFTPPPHPTMAVLLADLNFTTDDAFLSTINHGIQQVLQNTHVATTFHSMGASSSVAGFIQENEELVRAWSGLLTYSGAMDLAALEWLNNSHIPVVSLGEPPEGLSLSCVDIDNESGAVMAINHLLEQGCTKPLIIEGHKSNRAAGARLRGIRSALNKAGLAREERFILCLDGPFAAHTAERAQALVEPFLQSPGEVDSIYVFLEQNTVGVYRALERHGLMVGKDIPVIHYNDYPWLSQMLRPAPTAIRQPFTAMGRDATRMLLKHIDQANPVVEQRILQPLLIVRDSCGLHYQEGLVRTSLSTG